MVSLRILQLSHVLVMLCLLGRDAVVSRLMVPDLNFSLLLGQQQEDLLGGMSGAQQHQEQQQTAFGVGQQGLEEQQQAFELPGSEHIAESSLPASHGLNGNGASATAQHDDLQPAATSAGQSSSG